MYTEIILLYRTLLVCSDTGLGFPDVVNDPNPADRNTCTYT